MTAVEAIAAFEKRVMKRLEEIEERLTDLEDKVSMALFEADDEEL